MPRHGNPSVTQFWREWQHVVEWTELSYDRLKHKGARLQLFAWAYNLANSLRELALQRSIRGRNVTWFLSKTQSERDRDG